MNETVKTATVVTEELKIQSQEAIMERYKYVQPRDTLAFETSEYFLYMTYEHARKFMQKEYKDDEQTKKDWSDPPTVEQSLENMEEYMSFAWGKANNFRGISSDRSIRHYVAWSWLIGDEEFSARIDNANYEFYGKPILVMICQHYGWDHKQWDDGVRANCEPGF